MHFLDFSKFRFLGVENGSIWGHFRFAQTYSPVGLLDFHDFWYVGLLGGALGAFFRIFQNFDFLGLEGRKGSILGQF